VNNNTLRGWCKHAEIDSGRRATTTGDAARIRDQRFGVEPMCRVLCEHDVHIEDSDRDISECRWHRKVALRDSVG
jgi:hypothetical protein